MQPQQVLNQTSPLDLAKFKQGAQLTQLLATVTKQLEAINIPELEKLQGAPGEAGQAPVAGQDFLTPEEMQVIVNTVTPVKGVDYFTSEDITAIKEQVTPQLGVDYFTPDQVRAFLDEVTPVKGVHYTDAVAKDGKDAEIDQAMIDKAVEAALTKEKLEEAMDDTMIDIKRIKGLEKFKKDILESGYKKHKQTYGPRLHGLWGGGGGGNGAYNFNSVNSDTTLTINDRVIFVDASGGPVTLTLPAPTLSGVILYIKKIDTTDNEVIVQTGLGSIDGSPSKELVSAYQDLEIISSAPQSLWAIFH